MTEPGRNDSPRAPSPFDDFLCTGHCLRWRAAKFQLANRAGRVDRRAGDPPRRVGSISDNDAGSTEPRPRHDP